MKQGFRTQAPALALSLIALFAALGGTVYAAAKIDGKAIRAKSLPGNRLKLRSIPANRLKPGTLTALRQIGTLTGADINELTLGQVPNAAHADAAETAQSAVDAQTALNAVNALDAQTVNGHGAGCLAGTQAFAGACWQSNASESAETAADAAASCAAQGGTLPEALPLAAFAQLPGVALDAGDEWSGDLTNISGLDAYGTVIVTKEGEVGYTLGSNKRKFRCVIPLVT